RREGLDKMTQSLAKNLTSLTGDYKTMLIDTNDKKLAEIGNGMNAYISGHDGVIAVKEDLITEINNRLDNNDENEEWIVQFADFKDFCERSNLEDTEISTLIDQGVRVGIHLIL